MAACTAMNDRQVEFFGTCEGGGCDVFIKTPAGSVRPLDLRLDLRNHSPGGFAWGYNGSGPAQLALAMCAQLVDANTALRVYQQVKEALIAAIPQAKSAWVLTEGEVRAAIERAKRPLQLEVHAHRAGT